MLWTTSEKVYNTAKSENKKKCKKKRVKEFRDSVERDSVYTLTN